MNDGLRLRWLQASDALAVARLESLVYRRAQRTGWRGLREQLRVAEQACENLALGLFLGRRLIGYVLIFVEADVRNIASYTGLPLPMEGAPEGPGLYVVDVAVDPIHRRYAWPLLTCASRAIQARADLRALPRMAICTPALLSFWRARHRTLARLGFRLLEATPVVDPDTGQTWYWLHFAPGGPRTAVQAVLPAFARSTQVMTPEGMLTVGRLEEPCPWDGLRRHWDLLWERSADATVFTSHGYLEAWRQLPGVSVTPYIVVVQDSEGCIRAIAPMQLQRSRGGRGGRRFLTFLGSPAEVDRPMVLVAPEDQHLVQRIVDFITTDEEVGWSASILYEQQPDNPFLVAMLRRLSERGLLVATPAGPASAVVDLNGTWDAYLNARSKGQRKSFRRHLGRLRALGDLHMDTLDSVDTESTAFARYLALERRSWKAGTSVGIARSSVYYGFLQALRGVTGPRAIWHARFLVLNGADIAGTLGLYWKGCLYAIHIAHDMQWDACSPGFVLTGLELEQAFQRDDYQRVDYLAGFPTNKGGWATAVRPTRALFAHAPDVHGLGFHLYHFRCRPWIRRRLDAVHLLQPVSRLRRMLSRWAPWQGAAP